MFKSKLDMTNPLEIIFESDTLIAINKPHGLLVHRSRIAPDVTVVALQLLRDQIGMKVHLCHRIDRKTSGVLLFSKTKEMNTQVQKMFQERETKKVYKAIVRGYVEDCIIDYPLTNGHKVQESVTKLVSTEKFEIPLPFGHFQTSRYSLVTLYPETGRFHQIRKHLKHIHHPILGDRPHGCNKQNKLWKEKFQMTTMMLHAEQLSFELSPTENIRIKADTSEEFNKVLNYLRVANMHI